MRYQVLCMWDVETYPGVLDPLKEVADVTVLPAAQQDLVKEIGNFHAILPSLEARMDTEVLADAGNLKVICTPSTGLDHIDLAECDARGIEILCLKEDYDFLKEITATAEMAWCLLLAVVRRLPWGFDAAKQGFWARDVFRGHQIAYKTLGILGYGRLGEMVAEYGKAFRMNVLACDVKDFNAPGIERVDFSTLLRESDVISIHIHLTPENTGIIGRKEFSMMKPGSILINTSRGAVVDQEALLHALEHGPIGAVGVDVIFGEWDTNLYDHPLIRYARTHDNLVISPHVGGVTFESQRMAYRFTVDKLLKYLRNL